MKKAVVICIFLLVYFIVTDAKHEIKKTSSVKPGCESILRTNKDTLQIVAVGDIMLGSTYPDSSHLPPYDPYQLFKPLQPYLNNADICFGNLEGTLTDDLSEVKECNTDGRCYYFSMPTSYTRALRRAGFNLLSIANNHINDFGSIGRKSTCTALKKAGIHYAGLLNHQIDTFRIAGVKYGFCAFSPNANTVSIKEMAKAEKLIQRLDSVSDIVIVSFHAGGEGVAYQNITRKKEYYIGEDRGDVYRFAHRMIDAGADILLGHGPHISRAVEIYNKRFITYSMGNFCTYSSVSIAGLCGISPLYRIQTNREGEFLEAKIIPVIQQKFKSPRLDNSKKAIQIIRKLTHDDFPEMLGQVTISDEGDIKYTNEKAQQTVDKEHTEHTL